MRVAVTWAAGLVGRATVRALRAVGDEIIALVRPGGRLPEPSVRAHAADLANVRELEALFAGCDAVVHTAALLGGADDAVRASNIEGTRALIDAMRAARVPRIVFLSTVAVYGGGDLLDVDEVHPLQPGNAYASSKVLGEEMVRAACEAGSLAGFVLRPTTIYGAEDERGVTPFLLSLARDGVIPLVRGGRVRMDLVAADDVARACVLAAHASGGRGEPLHVSSDEGLDVRTIVERLRGLGLPTRTVDVADPEHPPAGVPRELVALVSEHRGFSIDRARTWISYQPKSHFPESLRARIEDAGCGAPRV